MKQELPSPQHRSCDSPQRASPPAGRRTCGLSAGPKPPHAERTRMGPDLQLHIWYSDYIQYQVRTWVWSLALWKSGGWIFILGLKMELISAEINSKDLIFNKNKLDFELFSKPLHQDVKFLVSFNLCYRARCGFSKLLPDCHLSPGETGPGCRAEKLHLSADVETRSCSHHTDWCQHGLWCLMGQKFKHAFIPFILV